MKKTCFKKLNGYSLDVFLTNHPRCFQSTCVIETGLSDHHGLVPTRLKSTFHKLPPKKIKYRDTKNFNEIAYKNDILSIDFDKIKNSDVEDSYKLLSDTVHDVIEMNVPMKTKMLRGNNAPFMTKDLKKAIMNISRYCKT